MPRRVDTPRDLLFGLLALQTGLIDHRALVLAFHAWTGPEGRPMAEILVEQGALDDDQRSVLEGLAAQHLKKHGGDPEKSLAVLGIDPSTRRKLAEVADPKLLDSLATVGVASSKVDHPDANGSRTIGTATSGGQRFRVLRPHAKGGLGEVFVALDAELNREVALKEIQDRHDQPASRVKFLVEAEITGGLEHPGIVPVYGLGHHEDGRPYYTMRFIKGDNLKEAIERFHDDEALKADPGARSLELLKLLRRFTDVCNAIEYAHSRGVLHRDIKPGNVIVGKHGETLVVDWGLAKARGRLEQPSTTDEPTLVPPSASGSNPTLPGEAFGTPAYMSPEQAAGDLERLGPRSDVYSLGATLYSLLTGRSAFEGDLGLILHNVQEGRFPRPRSIDPTIDPALEALCLKAMARAPEDRYPSPKALADDLDRWSADEPLVAWKEPLSRRLRRWARRNRTGVTAASAAAVALLVGLAAVLAVQSKANFDLKLKNGLLTEANLREAKANEELKLANDRVQSRFDLARESIDAFRAAVKEERVFKGEPFRPLRAKLLRSAADFYDKLGSLLEGQSDPRSRKALADAYRELGNLTDAIGAKAEVSAIFRKEVAIRRELAQGREPADRLELANSLNRSGKAAGAAGDATDALAMYDEARRILESESWPSTVTNVSLSSLATSYYEIGYVTDRSGDTAKAMTSFDRALSIEERLAASRPDVVDYQIDLATTHDSIGGLQKTMGEAAKALVSYGRSLAINERLASADPADENLQSDLALRLNNLASLYEDIGENSKAMDYYRRSLAINERLASANPAITEYQDHLAGRLNNVGLLLGRMSEPEKAAESLARAVEIRERLATANPTFVEFQANLAGAIIALGSFYQRMHEPARAMDYYQRGLKIQEPLVASNPTIPRYQVDLANIYNNIAALHSGNGDLARAVESIKSALAIRERLAAASPSDVDLQSTVATTHNNVGFLLEDLGEPSKAREAYDRALSIQERLIAASPTLTEIRSESAYTIENLGHLHEIAGQQAQAMESLGRALAIRERLALDNPNRLDYRRNYRDSLIKVGVMAIQLGRAKVAVESLRRGVSEANVLARQPTELYNLARYQARLSQAVAMADSGSSSAEVKAEGDRAVAFLEMAVKAGYRDVRNMRANKSFDAIRSRQDFQDVLLDAAFPDPPFAR